MYVGQLADIHVNEIMCLHILSVKSYKRAGVRLKALASEPLKKVIFFL